jgi:hypothetical protein
MATFGQGVNASLGKTDYSNYLAGALQGARGVAAGGQSIGQGVANLGQQVGAGIEAYAKKKQEDKELSASNKVNSAILELFGQSDALTTKQKLEVDSMMLSYAQLDGVRERNAFLKNALSGVMNMAELGEKTANAQSLRDLRDAQRAGMEASAKAAERKKSEDEKFARAVAANTEAGTGVVNTEGIASAFAQEGGSNLSEYNKDIAAFEGESKLQKIEGTDYGIINGQVIPLHEASKDKADKAAYEKKKRDYEALPRGEKFSQEIDAIDKAVSSGFLSEVDRDSAVADVKKRIYGVRDEDELSGMAALMALSEIINKQPNAK